MVFLHQESWVQKRSNHCLLDLANGTDQKNRGFFWPREGEIWINHSWEWKDWAAFAFRISPKSHSRTTHA